MESKRPAIGANLLRQVERLAGEGFGKGEIAQRLGFKATSTLNSRLVKASQASGKPIPILKSRARSTRSRTETVQVRRRGAGDSFGVNIPREPLERLGLKPGDRLTVKVRRGRIVLVADAPPAEGKAGPRPPRLIKKSKARRDDTST